MTNTLDKPTLKQRAQIAITTLKNGLPRRTYYDFLKFMVYLAFIAVGMIYSYFSYLFIREKIERTVGTASEMVKGIMASREKDYNEAGIVIYSHFGFMHNTRVEQATYISSCAALAKKEPVKISPECILKEKTYTSFKNLLPYLESAEKLLNSNEFLTYSFSPGFLCILMAVMMIAMDERRRLALSSSTLTDAEITEIKTLGRQLKIQISHNAPVDLLIAMLETRMKMIEPERSVLAPYSMFMFRKAAEVSVAVPLHELKEVRI